VHLEGEKCEAESGRCEAGALVLIEPQTAQTLVTSGLLKHPVSPGPGSAGV
jgi:hypothetical protein